jgi:hypothetical protein
MKQSYAVICLLIAESLGHNTLGQKLSLMGQIMTVWPENKYDLINVKVVYVLFEIPRECGMILKVYM